MSAGSSAVFVAQITDPHLRVDAPQRTRQLQVTVETLRALELPLAAVIVSGDVTDLAEPASYAAAAEALAPIDAPLVVVPGNHDDRPGLRAAFGLPGAPEDPIRGAVVAGGVRIVACDTTVPGLNTGMIDRPWLAARLLDDPSTPTLLVMHHCPVAVGIPPMDALGVPADDRAALAELLRFAPTVRGVLTGHVHRAALGRVGGVPVVACGSSDVQLAFVTGGGIVIDDDAPPVLTIHALIDGRLVSHVQPVPRVS